MNRAAKQHLAKARELVAKGDSFYWKAGLEIVAAQEADSTLSASEIGKTFDRGEKWVRTLVRHVTTSSPETSIDWDRGSHGTKAEMVEGARKLLSNPNEAAKLISSLDTKGQSALAKAVVANPRARGHIEHEQQQQHEATRHNPVDVREPKFPLLHRIEGDRLKLESAAELMAGHWHDGRHDVGDEESRLVRDSMAEAVIQVEKIVTGALRTEKEVGDPK